MTRTASDLLRLLAMAAVVFIHGTSGGEWRFAHEHRFASEDGLAVLINQLGRFCVPLFVLMSGYGLAARQLKVGLESPWAFYRDRASRILLPFLVLTPVFLLMRQGFHMTWADLGLAFLHGRGDYHFYFFPIILCCYLFFPLLSRLPGSLWAWLLMALAIPWASPMHLVREAWAIPLPSLPSWAPPMWIGYFALGVLWAKFDFEKRPKAIPFFVSVVVVLLAAAAVLAEYRYWSLRHPDHPDWYNHFQRLVVIAYALAFWIFFRSYAARFGGWMDRAAPVIGRLAALSFPLYLFHTWVLRLLEMSPLKASTMALSASTLILTFGVVFALEKILPGGLYRAALGLPEKKMG